ncbi:uncharacterized protein LOC129229792 isoform X1 [Uloborus diversus]|uniref:uncharacterized protein LOC129229792 isoform X1 n=1 Tax=Uloborus diversus TaxID=327109 RepID=UPI002409BDDD|nr:uncharacterized protein LOC129229792 isoform X1 [Uloborus diversus]
MQMYGNLVQVCFCSWDSSMDIPASDSFSSPLKTGFLEKLIGRGWLYSGSWKKRYCVLDGSKFYFYENEHCKGYEKTCGVINLDYYDVCEENSVKDKKNPHVFLIGTSVRGFFDNRHQFATESVDELRHWIEAIQGAIAEARLNRRKPARKQHQQQHQRPLVEGKSPDLSNSSQEESEGASTTCLVNATKDRVKGPQGRRLPQRKSMMPTARTTEETTDMRQRSISLSSPETSEDIPEEPNERLQTSTSENKWLSLSMEEVDRERDPTPGQRSNSAFDLPQEHATPLENGGILKMRCGLPRMGGNLLGQHAALARELEMKLKAGRIPGPKRPLSPEGKDGEEEQHIDAETVTLEDLSSRVESTKDTLNQLEERLGHLTNRVETTNEKNEKAKSEVGDILLQVTVILKEAERINAESKRTLNEIQKSKLEHQGLAQTCKECKAAIAKSKEEQELQKET